MPTSSESVQFELAIVEPSANTPALYAIHDNVITIPEDLTKEQWFIGMRLLKRTNDNYKLILAQYIAYGEAKFGKDSVEDSLRQLEFDLPTIKQCMDINTVPLEIRQPLLTAEHYVILARAELKDDKARGKWAKIANDQNLSPVQLKVSIAEGEVVSTTVAKQRSHGIITIDGILQEFDIWIKRMRGVEGILKLGTEDIRAIIKDLKPISDLYQELMHVDLSAPRKKRTKSKQPASKAKSKTKAKKAPVKKKSKKK